MSPYPVEITFDEYTEDALTARMTAMREWLDHYRFEPTIFRHTFTKTGLLFQVYFDIAGISTFGEREEKSG